MLFPIEQTLGNTINIGREQVCGSLELWDRGRQGGVDVPESGNPVKFQSIVNNEAVRQSFVAQVQERQGDGEG